jgi:hypothetical protein
MENRCDSIRLADLPLLVRVAAGLSLFSTWVIFEEGISQSQ